MNKIELEKTIDDADNNYYLMCDDSDVRQQHNNHVLTDTEYDTLKIKLKKLDPDNKRNFSVGVNMHHNQRDMIFKKEKHDFMMGSLSNAMTDKEYTSWLSSISGISTNTTWQQSYVIAQPKCDGLSLNLVYENGVLVKAITRGDGITGENVTANAMLMSGVPHKLHVAFNGSIRGEVLLYDVNWRKIDPNEKSNPRNLGAGICRRKNGKECELLNFMAFDCHVIHNENLYETETEKISFMNKKLGFDTVPILWRGTIKESIPEMKNVLNKVKNKSPCFNIPHATDGIVIKINSINAQETINRTQSKNSKRPKSQIAYKWLSDEAVTVLESVAWNIGKGGMVTPVAKLRPTKLSGVTISSALLCNMYEIERLGIAIGDEIIIKRAGEVIPKIVRLHKKAENRIEIIAPTEIDGYQISHKKLIGGDDNELSVNLYIDRKHPDVQLGALIHFLKKMDIKGMGQEVITAIYKNGIIKTPDIVFMIVDEYRKGNIHTRDAIIHSIGNIAMCGGSDGSKNRTIGCNRIRKIMDEQLVPKLDKIPIDIFMGSMNIESLGTRRTRIIIENAYKNNINMNHFNKIDDDSVWLCGDALEANAGTLGIVNIWKTINESIKEHTHVIENSIKYCTIEPIVFQQQQQHDNNTTNTNKGLTFCFTGVRIKDDEIREKFKKMGHIEKSGVSKSLDYLVCADITSTSGKVRKAKDINTIKILSMDDFVGMINNIV